MLFWNYVAFLLPFTCFPFPILEIIGNYLIKSGSLKKQCVGQCGLHSVCLRNVLVQPV